MTLYTYELYSVLELHHQIQVLLIRFSALALILSHYFSVVTETLGCIYSDRNLLQSLKGKAQPKWHSCKQVRDYESKTNKGISIFTLTLRYSESVSKSASGVTVSKQDSKPLHLAGGTWESRLPGKSWRELLQYIKMKSPVPNNNRLQMSHSTKKINSCTMGYITCQHDRHEELNPLKVTEICYEAQRVRCW